MSLRSLNFHWNSETRLDAHAHLAADVTRSQLERLGDVLVFAMTRTLGDAERARHRKDARVLWGCGVHPSSQEALESFDPAAFARLLDHFAVIGEVGLDAASGQLGSTVFRQILAAVGQRGVLMSIHCSKAEAELLALLDEFRPKAPILHWYRGPLEMIEELVAAGCYFSVNSRMSSKHVERIPAGRVLTETDYPSTRRSGGTIPGATGSAEQLIATAFSEPRDVVRMRVWENLSSLLRAAGLTVPLDWPACQTETETGRTLF